MPKAIIYHNAEARFMPYQPGQQLTAVMTCWLHHPTITVTADTTLATATATATGAATGTATGTAPGAASDAARGAARGAASDAASDAAADAGTGDGARAIADWAFYAFNVDLDTLEARRTEPDGENTFLAACVYRLLGHRSLSIGDVVELRSALHSRWLACEAFGWRDIPQPANLPHQSTVSVAVYRRLTARRG
jgi:hypothetical protein